MLRNILLAGFSVVLTACFSAPSFALTASQLSHMTKEQKIQAQKYFRSHSL